MDADMKQMMVEMQASIQGLATQTQASIQGLATQTQASIQGLTTEMRTSIKGLEGRFDGLEGRFEASEKRLNAKSDRLALEFDRSRHELKGDFDRAVEKMLGIYGHAAWAMDSAKVSANKVISHGAQLIDHEDRIRALEGKRKTRPAA